MRAYDFLKEVQLNELRDYLDLNYYGSWIHPNGSIDAVNDHNEWLIMNFGDIDIHSVAFDAGYVRVVHPSTFYKGTLTVMGEFDNVKKTFKYWWPSALHSDSVMIEDENWKNAHTYSMPKDKNQLLKDFGQ